MIVQGVGLLLYTVVVLGVGVLVERTVCGRAQKKREEFQPLNKRRKII